MDSEHYDRDRVEREAIAGPQAADDDLGKLKSSMDQFLHSSLESRRSADDADYRARMHAALDRVLMHRRLHRALDVVLADLRKRRCAGDRFQPRRRGR